MKKVSKGILVEMNKSKSMQNIAKELGVHRDTIRRWFKTYKLKSKFGNGQSEEGNGYEVALFAKCHGEKRAMTKYQKTKDQMYKILWKFDRFLYAEQK